MEPPDIIHRQPPGFAGDTSEGSLRAPRKASSIARPDVLSALDRPDIVSDGMSRGPVDVPPKCNLGETLMQLLSRKMPP
jgi:hypothetical protein